MAVLLVVVALGWAFVSNAWLALSSPGLSGEPMTSPVATIVSVRPGEVVNRDEIEEACRVADREGVLRDEAAGPEPYLGECTVTFTFVVGVVAHVQLRTRDAALCHR